MEQREGKEEKSNPGVDKDVKQFLLACVEIHVMFEIPNSKSFEERNRNWYFCIKPKIYLVIRSNNSTPNYLLKKISSKRTYTYILTSLIIVSKI